MTEYQLALELLIAFLLGGFFIALLPRGLDLVRHHSHAFEHVYAYLDAKGLQRDLRVCKCGVTKWIWHDGRVCTH